MIGRSLTMAVALFSAFLASQAPEFAQQYRQRLGGAVEELGRVVSDFDRDAAAVGMDRRRAVDAMKANQEMLIRLRGASMDAAISRYDRLKAQLDAFEQSGSLGRVAALLDAPDQPLARATFDHYEPAVPTTIAGIVTAGAGFALVYAVLAGLVHLVRPRRRTRRWRWSRDEGRTDPTKIRT